jgi:lysozyme family protein
MNTWHTALETVLRHEGGFSNHPADRGGPTYAGVSLKAVKSLDGNDDGTLDFDLDQDGDVDLEDIRALAVHPEKVAEFYRTQYWAPLLVGGELPARVAIVTFDAAVHHGVRPAIVLLQRAVGAKADGVLGPRTVSAAWNTRDAHEHALTERGLLMHRIVVARPASAVFHGGWLRRLFALCGQVSAMRASS